MKVFLVTGSFKSTTFINRLAKGLSDKGLDVSILGKNDLTHSQRISNVRYLDFGFNWITIFYIFYYLGLRCFFSKTLYKKILLKDLSSLRIWLSSKYAKKYKPDIIHFQWPVNEDWINSFPETTKKVLSLRGRLINTAPIAFEKVAKSYKTTFPMFDGFHGVSNAIIDKAKKYDDTILNRSQVIYSGLPLSNLRYLQNKKNNIIPTIISIGRSNWIKGYSFAIDAFHILMQEKFKFRYIIVGGIGQENLYHISDFGLQEEIKLLKRKPFEEVKNLIKKADLLLLPSVEEGIANVVLEAMALGTIVICTKCGGMEEVIEDGVNGFLVEVRDSIAIAEKMKYVISLNDVEKNNIRKNARKAIEIHYSEQIMVNQMVSFYKSLLNEN